MNPIPDVITDTTRRQEFVMLFDVTNGNPNGDPDAANAPRLDPETGHGLVTDVALKRKVRDFVALTRGLPLFIQSNTALNTLKAESAEKLTQPLTADERAGKKPIPRLRSQLCADYYDIRMFGAVLATGEAGDRLNAGQVRGPVQMTFARSQDRILPLEATITRQARTTEERMTTGTTEMGRKFFIPYALYQTHGYINPFLAERTGVTSMDLASFWDALCNLFEFDRSASRGDMAVRGLYVFTHDSKLGNARASTLFDLVQVSSNVNPDQISDQIRAPRKFTDYEVGIDETNMPQGVTLTRLVG